MTDKLTADELTLIRGDRCLVDGLGFALASGQLLVLEGPNGSGKTTLLRTLAGLFEPETGEVRWNGEPIRHVRQRYAANVAWLAHRVGFKGDLTLVENLRFERCLRATAGHRFDAVVDRLGLARLKKLPLRALSAGQQRRVGLARLLLAEARLWLLDEPFTNLDRDGRELVTRLIGEHLARDGLCAIAAHQDVSLDVTTQTIRLA